MPTSGLPEQAALPVEQADDPIRRQRLRVKHEAVVLLQERYGTTAGNQAFRFVLGTAGEVAQPTEIAVRARCQHEDIHLMGRHADPGLLVHLGQGPGLRLPQAAELAGAR